jgi:nucleotide-binding universal stress UspA family protein
LSAPIVVGFDGSDCARAALAEGLRLGTQLDAEVVAVLGYAPGRLGGEITDYAKALQETGTEILQRATHQAEAAGASVKIELVDDNAVEALTKAADKYEAQLIVVGGHGEWPLKGVILGSTPYRLLHVSPRPVLVVPG